MKDEKTVRLHWTWWAGWRKGHFVAVGRVGMFPVVLLSRRFLSVGLPLS